MTPALLVLVPMLAAPPAGATAPVRFADVTAASGIDFVHHLSVPIPGLFQGQNERMGVGAAVSDYDRDGDQDLYLCDSFQWPNCLYRNDGRGHFTLVTAEAGVGDRGYGHTALFADLDNDGFDDLLVVNDYNPFGNTWLFRGSQVFRNDGNGRFTNVSQASGFLPSESTIGGATAGDYDHDGDLDVFVTGWYDWSTTLYRNDGNFHFTDVTDEAKARPSGLRSQFTPVFCDVDGDGWPDIFCAVDFLEDYLLHNNGDGTFTDVSRAVGITHDRNGMGAAVADIDGDLDLDIYSTNITGKHLCPFEQGCNVLYLNTGDGHFIDATAEFGLGDTSWGWGVWIFDADLDGNQDLLAVNGWADPEFENVPAFFYRNDGQGGFREQAAEAGIAHAGNTRALVPLDLEGDGDTDFLMIDDLGPATVYENRSPRGDRHWLVVRAEGRRSNRNGVGARVYVTAGGRTQMQEIISGGSFYASPPLEARFGLGSAARIDEVRVVFPSGRTARRLGIAGDRRLTIVEPAAAR